MKRGYRVEVDEIDEVCWANSLDGFVDANLYQTWSYGATRWGRNNLSHLVLKDKDEVLAMAQLRIVRPAGIRCGIAYLRWGPVCERKGGTLEPRIVQEMADSLHEEYVIRRGLFLRILPHGVQDSQRASIMRHSFHDFETEHFQPGDSYRTMILDLSPDVEDLRKRLDQKWRNQLNRAEKNALIIKEGEGEEEFEIMSDLYREMWERKQFSRSSDIQEYQRIQENLPLGQKMRVFLCFSEGKPVAGVVATALGQSGIYLLGGTSNEGMQSKGAYALQWRVIQWCKESGMRYYNLGGINPVTNPGVHHFKKGMSGKDVLYMEPMIACRNPLSAVFAKVGMGLRNKIRSLVSAK